MNDLNSAIIGGISGGVFSVIGVVLANSYDRNKSKTQSLEESLALLRSLRSEMKYLIQQYQSTVGNALDKLEERQAFFGIHRAEEQYFSVFNTSASMLGCLGDTKLEEKIIESYVIAKSMLDSLRVNNALIERYDSVDPGPGTHPANAFNKARPAIEALRDFGDGLRRANKTLTKQLYEAIEMLDNHEKVIRKNLKDSRQPVRSWLKKSLGSC